MNGIAVTDYDGTPVIINFAYVVMMTKTKTEGTARFRAEALGIDCIHIRLATPLGHVLWITDPSLMLAVWTYFQMWCAQAEAPKH